jgi:hypothetical protein
MKQQAHWQERDGCAEQPSDPALPQSDVLPDLAAFAGQCPPSRPMAGGITISGSQAPTSRTQEAVLDWIADVIEPITGLSKKGTAKMPGN